MFRLRKENSAKDFLFCFAVQGRLRRNARREWLFLNALFSDNMPVIWAEMLMCQMRAHNKPPVDSRLTRMTLCSFSQRADWAINPQLGCHDNRNDLAFCFVFFPPVLQSVLQVRRANPTLACVRRWGFGRRSP